MVDQVRAAPRAPVPAAARTSRQPVVGLGGGRAHNQSLALPRRTSRPEREVLGARALHRERHVAAVAVVGAARLRLLRRRERRRLALARQHKKEMYKNDENICTSKVT